MPSLFVDHKGTLWVGTMDGLDAFDPATDRFRVYRASGDGLNQYQVIAEDSQGRLWLGTQFTGLQRLDPSTGQFTIYRNSPGTVGSLSNDNVTAICIDASGIIWIGTQGGLNRFDPVAQTFTTYYERDGLPNNRIAGILEDERGNLWLSTRNGLSRFDPRTKTFANYSASDGIVRGNIYGPHAGWKGSRGEMFFASTAGVIAFFPEKVVDNSYMAPVVLTDFQLFGKPTAVGGRSPLNQSITFTNSLTLSARQTVFSLEFSALSYVDPDLNRYRYRLEGLETEWNETSSAHRLVTYTTLPSGDYVFHVQGANNHGLWNERGASIRIRILPPWWSTSWFRTIVGASLLLSLWCVYYLRVQRVERRQAEIRALNEQLIKGQEAERMRIAGDLHDGILQQITSLTLQARHGETSGACRFGHESKDRRCPAGNASDWNRHPAYIARAASRLATGVRAAGGAVGVLRGVQQSTRSAGVVRDGRECAGVVSGSGAVSVPHRAGSAGQCRQVFGSQERLRFGLREPTVTCSLSVSDDGVGCTPDHIAKSGGLGVINMRERVLQLNGTFEFDSAPGRGTTVKVEVPFRPA